MAFNLNSYAGQLLSETRFPGLPGEGRRLRYAGATITDLANRAPIEISSMPSATISKRPGGGTNVTLHLKTRYADSLGDLKHLHAVAKQVVRRMEAQSHGPLKTRQQRALGHPYGRDKGGVGRKLPRTTSGRRIGHVAGIRGSVPDLSVINQQSTNGLATKWGYEIIRTSAGVDLVFFNEADYSFWLAAGTRTMQAHGPWSYVLIVFRSQIRSAWQKDVLIARENYIGAQVING